MAARQKQVLKSTVVAAWLAGALTLGRLAHEYVYQSPPPRAESTRLQKSAIPGRAIEFWPAIVGAAVSDGAAGMEVTSALTYSAVLGSLAAAAIAFSMTMGGLSSQHAPSPSAAAPAASVSPVQSLATSQQFKADAELGAGQPAAPRRQLSEARRIFEADAVLVDKLRADGAKRWGKKQESIPKKPIDTAPVGAFVTHAAICLAGAEAAAEVSRKKQRETARQVARQELSYTKMAAAAEHAPPSQVLGEREKLRQFLLSH
eukprot:TRINITY_DN42567_c0_g1_i1.p1 TRINITY_DN42567_c0_g1~~TRINITY_DN42567_c0_g1_i1.p1  ORF type:complete len:302 (+),score=76.64 TRINITY_DN42567_c0_g1_i1:128-907(+)